MGKAGKIDEKFFKSVILPESGRARAEVLQGPQFGVDVAIVETTHDMAMLLTSDPLSLIPGLGLEESAWLSVHLMANDMATTSFSPQYMQAVLNLPVGLSDEDFRKYWRHIDRFCKEIGTAITGGHTGSVEGQNSTICGGGTMISIAPRDQVLTTPMAKAGDSIFMTSGAAISSASILALSFSQTVTQKLGKETAQNAQGLFYQTSVLPVAGIVNHLNSRQPVVHAMHDVTEGGVWGPSLKWLRQLTWACNCIRIPF